MQREEAAREAPLLSLLIPALALAIAPNDEGIEPQRLLRYSPHVQARLLSSSEWRDFEDSTGGDWHARFDEETGTPHRMWGDGIRMGDTGPEVEANLLEFVSKHEQLLGVDERPWTLSTLSYNATFDTWYADFDVFADGAPIWRGGLTARVKHGNLVLFGADSYPNSSVVGQVQLTESEAIHGAVSGGPVPDAEHTEREATLVALPQIRDDALVLVLVWEVRTRTQNPPGIWVSMVDADSGEVLNVHNEVRFAGTVMGEHDDRHPGNGLVTSPLPRMSVGSSTTNEFGGYSGSGGTARFDGPGLNINNRNGPEWQQSVSGSVTVTSAQADQAEISSWVFLNDAQGWGEQFAPSIGIVASGVQNSVNLNDVCNAYYDGTLNFYRAGSGCNNTGRIADVNYHEWGHGLHHHSLQAGYFDGAVSEGAGDFMSSLMTDDPKLSPYFFTNGAALREIETDRVYPDDLVNEVHEDGLIFAGAMWDFRQLLESTGSTEHEAWTTSSRVFAGLLKGGPGLEDAYDEAMVADDDDGSLGNGTPSECELLEAFGGHGLGPSATMGGAMVVGHEALIDVDAYAPIQVSAGIVSSGSGCLETEAAGGSVHYRVDGGSWASAPLNTAGDDVAGLIPAQAEGAIIEYWLEVSDLGGNLFVSPASGSIAPYTAVVGGSIDVWCTDFETDDGGFTHELVSGQNSEGADDWQWGRPGGLSGDPTFAHSGDRAWGNDLGASDYNGAYQPNKHNRLISPVVSIPAHLQGAFLRYHRWLNVEDGFYDQAFITVDDAEVWRNHNHGMEEGADEHTTDGDWLPHVVDLGAQADDGSVRITWEIVTDAGLEMGGWTLDDVCISVPATVDNRLAITDFDASDAGVDGGVTLSWTNPQHGPMDRVAVVRKTDGFPTGLTDGDVVFEDLEPQPGAFMSLRDLSVDSGVTYFYAVYGADGDDALSWTVEGWNADMGDGHVTEEDLANAEEGDIVPKRGCGCSSAPAGPSGLWMLLMLTAIRVRRR